MKNNVIHSYTNYRRVCIVNNMYALLQYLLISTIDDINNTFFFFADDVPDIVTGNFPHWVKFNTPSSTIGKILFLINMRFLIRKRYKFLDKATIFGQDNLLLTPPLLAKGTMNVLEDGMSNYTLVPPLKSCKWIRSIISPLLAQQSLGYSDSCSRIYLTGKGPIPGVLKDKTCLINLDKLWNDSSERKRNLIIHLFNLTADIIKDFQKCKAILITQPLSEDKVITEEEKISLYRRMINGKNIAIKPHPREQTDYRNYFPENQILESHVPMELLSLAGIRFTDVYTIFSTAAMQFSENSTIHFMGTGIHPKLVERYGDVRYEKGKVVSRIL